MESVRQLSYAGAVLTIKRGDSTFHLLLQKAVRSAQQKPKPPAGHKQRQLWFGTSILAETFLRSLLVDRNAGKGMSDLLVKVDGVQRANVSTNSWIPELGPRLVSGEVLVFEVKAPSPPGGDNAKTEKKKKQEVVMAVPRKGPAQEKVEAPETATFTNVSEDAQANALIAAAQAGAALCEVCNKAAASS